jgi:hypothetical protein
MIQPTKWSVPLGSGADVQDLPDDDLKYASFSKIFPQITQVPLSAGGVAPRRIDFNSLFKLLADNIYFYQNGGVFEYSDTADYEKGAIVRYNDNIYLCIQDNSALNTHNPEDMDYWLRVALNNELADYLPLAGGNVTGNLSVQNKNVVRSVNGVNADAQGNVQGYYPSYDTFINIPVPETVTEQTDTPYTVQYNGLLVLACASTGFPNHLRISTSTRKLLASNIEWSADVAQCISVPVVKGQQLILSYESAKNCGATLYPCRGEI